MTPPPDIWCCRTVELAVRVLPREHRQRYGLEIIAELYGMPKAQQRRHSIQVLSRAWALRAALDAATLAPIQEKAEHRIRAWLLCHLGRHLWAQHRNPEVSGRDAVFEQCRRCGRERRVRGAPAGIGSRRLAGRWATPVAVIGVIRELHAERARRWSNGSPVNASACPDVCRCCRDRRDGRV